MREDKERSVFGEKYHMLSHIYPNITHDAIGMLNYVVALKNAYI